MVVFKEVRLLFDNFAICSSIMLFIVLPINTCKNFANNANYENYTFSSHLKLRLGWGQNRVKTPTWPHHPDRVNEHVVSQQEKVIF